MTEKNKAILKEVNAVVTEGDYEKFLSYCSEDTDWTFADHEHKSGDTAFDTSFVERV